LVSSDVFAFLLESDIQPHMLAGFQKFESGTSLQETELWRNDVEQRLYS